MRGSAQRIPLLFVEDNPRDVELVHDLLYLAGHDRYELFHVDRISEAIRRLESGRVSVPRDQTQTGDPASGASQPHDRMPRKVSDGEHDRGLGLDDEEHAEGDRRRIARRVEGVQLCLRPNRGTRHLPVAAETFLHAFDDLFPRTCFVESAAVFGQAFFQKRLLPVLQRAGRRGDAIPKRLHVLDLILDWKRVESRRRQRQGVGQARNIPPGVPAPDEVTRRLAPVAGRRPGV